MCVITEKKLQLNIARLCCHNFLSLVVFWLGGARAPLATPMDRRYFCKSRRYLRTKSKNSLVETWQNSPKIMPTFAKLSFIKYSSQISEFYFQALEEYVVSLCISTINACKITVARRILFAKRERTVENILPTLDSLKQHIKQSAFQVFKWRQCLIIDPSSSLVDPNQWDWQETDSEYFPVWTVFPAASIACRIAFKCGWKKYCKGATNEIVFTEVRGRFTFINRKHR